MAQGGGPVGGVAQGLWSIFPYSKVFLHVYAMLTKQSRGLLRITGRLSRGTVLGRVQVLGVRTTDGCTSIL